MSIRIRDLGRYGLMRALLSLLAVLGKFLLRPIIMTVRFMRSIHIRDLGRYGLMVSLLAVLGVFLLWPIIMTVSAGFSAPEGGFTLRYFVGSGVGVLRDPIYLRGLFNSLAIAACTTALCFVITVPLALAAARCEFPGKALLSSLMMVPLILPPFVGAIGLRMILGRAGSVNTMLANLGWTDGQGVGLDLMGGEWAGGRFLGVVVMEALHLYPVLYLNTTAALANLDPAMDEAAQNLGASWWRRLWSITLPLAMPGIFAGSVVVFIWSFTELGTPLMFDFNVATPVQVFWGVKEVAGNPRPYALVVVMLVAAVSLYLLGKFALGRRGHAMQGKASIAAQPRRLTGPLGWGVSALFLGVITLAVVPHIGVVLASLSSDGAWYRSILPTQWTLDHYANALSHELAVGSIQNSLLLATAAMGGCLAMGLCVSYLSVRAKLRGVWLLDAMAMLPLAVPGLVMAFGYVAMTVQWPFGKGQPLAGWLDVVGVNPNPVPLLIIAYAVRRLPYVVRSASAGLEQTSEQLEEAALNLGASTVTALRRVVFPLIMANLIAAAILVFSFSMLEVSDSLMLAQKQQHFPITKAIFEFYNRLGDGPYIASAMGVWGMALLTVTMVGAGLLMGRRLGAIFRA